MSIALAPPVDRPPRPTAARSGPAPPPAPPPVVPPVLLAQQDVTGRAMSLTVLVPGASGTGGALVLIPPGTLTEMVSLGLEPVGRALELGGPSRLRATVENLLGAALSGEVVVNDATMATLVAPAGPLEVQVPERVEELGPNGRVNVLFEAGPTRLAPAGAARFLSVRGRGSDLARLTRHQAFWDAWLAAMRQRSSAVPAQPAVLSQALRALAAGSVETRVVPVEAFGTAGTSGTAGTAEGGELYRVRSDELARMVSSLFPTSARRGAAERPRVQVLNGTGALGVADAVRDKLGPGFDVRLTGNASRFDYERTEVVFYDRGRQATAERVRQALGVGTLVLSRTPLDVVDVTIIVGKDFHP